MTREVEDLEDVARRIRKQFLAMHFAAKAGHIGSGLSDIDILTYLYWRYLSPADRFVLSKGHAASSLYATLYVRGLFTEAMINTYYRDGTTLPAHPAAMAHAEIPAASGSLGHGLAIASGMAYAGLYVLPVDSRFVCLLSDGECNEGAVWESALFAAHHRLSNLTVLLDANGLQGFGTTKEVMNLEPLPKKWEAFGFHVEDIDGHDFSALDRALSATSDAGKPRCIVCRTVKGKGVSFMENRMEWHYLPMSPEQYQQAMSELGP